MSNDLRMWLTAEVAAAEEAVENKEAIAYYAAASDRMGCMADLANAKVNAKVARQLLAEMPS